MTTMRIVDRSVVFGSFSSERSMRISTTPFTVRAMTRVMEKTMTVKST